jgi:hypothetical protein
VLEGRNKRKIITNKLMLALVDQAKSKKDFDMVQPYWNTYHCLEKIHTANGKLFGDYCKNRFCTLCSSIKKATMVNQYLPILLTWDNPQFVTLTIKSVNAKSLNKWLGGMVTAFEKISNRCKSRNRRGEGIKLVGIKSLECNFNPKKRWYNPHFHLIVPNKEIADLLVKEWISQWKGYASKLGQKIIELNDAEKGLIEVLKYSTKVFTEIDVNKGRVEKSGQKIYIAAMHNIFRAMKGHRLFGKFGFKLPKEATKKKSKVSALLQYEEWKFKPDVGQYLNSETDEVFFDYILPNDIQYLLNNKIDIVLD